MTSGIQTFKDLLELISYAAVILGVPVALTQYIRATRKEQRDREYGTYDALDEKYLQFQRLCLAHSRLDVWDIPDPKRQELSPQELKQECLLFTILFAIFERAFLMYSDMSSEVKRRQWQGWDKYIRAYCSRTNFRDAWKVSGSTFDTDFEEYMRRVLAETVVVTGEDVAGV